MFSILQVEENSEENSARLPLVKAGFSKAKKTNKKTYFLVVIVIQKMRFLLDLWHKTSKTDAFW